MKLDLLTNAYALLYWMSYLILFGRWVSIGRKPHYIKVDKKSTDVTRCWHAQLDPRMLLSLHQNMAVAKGVHYMAVRIIGIRKPGDNYSAYEAISHFKWRNEQNEKTGINTRQEMVAWVEQGNRAYVSSSEGTVDCYVNTSPAGTKFLQTNADSRSSNNLLNLPEF